MITTLICGVFGVGWGLFCANWTQENEKSWNMYFCFGVGLFLGNLLLNLAFDSLTAFAFWGSILGACIFSAALGLMKERLWS